MAKTKKDAVTPVLPNTPEMEALLGLAYKMDAKKAEMIIADWEKNGSTSKFPYERYEAAEAFLAAYTSKPVVISKRQPWRRLR